MKVIAVQRCSSRFTFPSSFQGGKPLPEEGMLEAKGGGAVVAVNSAFSLSSPSLSLSLSPSLSFPLSLSLSLSLSLPGLPDQWRPEAELKLKLA